MNVNTREDLYLDPGHHYSAACCYAAAVDGVLDVPRRKTPPLHDNFCMDYLLPNINLSSDHINPVRSVKKSQLCGIQTLDLP